jgi:integration host factor subunit beta
MFDSMTNALQGGDRIEIRGFGSFSVRNRRSRQGRNPKTGETISVPAKRVPFFTVGHELKKTDQCFGWFRV